MESRPNEGEESPEPVNAQPAGPVEPAHEVETVEIAPAVSWVAPGLPRKRLVPGVAGLIYAGVIPRAIAWFLDSFLIALTSIVVLGVLIEIIVGTPLQEAGSPKDAALSVITCIGIAVIAFVYFMGFWTGPRRATPGMRLLRLQVGFVATGEPLTVRQAALRVVALGVPLWPLIAVPQIGVISGLLLLIWLVVLLVSTAVNARRRGLHDRVAWSAVVTPGGRPRSA